MNEWMNEHFISGSVAHNTVTTRLPALSTVTVGYRGREMLMRCVCILDHWEFPFLPRYATQSATYCYGKVVRLSVTLRFRDHIMLEFLQIPPLVSWTFALCTFQHHGSIQGNHPEILTWKGYRKSGFRRAKALISLKRGKIVNTRFRLVQKSTTVNDH